MRAARAIAPRHMHPWFIDEVTLVQRVRSEIGRLQDGQGRHFLDYVNLNAAGQAIHLPGMLHSAADCELLLRQIAAVPGVLRVESEHLTVAPVEPKAMIA